MANKLTNLEIDILEFGPQRILLLSLQNPVKNNLYKNYNMKVKKKNCLDMKNNNERVVKIWQDIIFV